MQGLICYTDVDCYSGSCDLLSNRCIIAYEEQQRRFLQVCEEGLSFLADKSKCLLETGSPFIIKQLLQQHNITSRDTTSVVTQLMTAYLVFDCIADSGLAIPYQSHWEWQADYLDSCPDIIYGLYSWANVPTACMQTDLSPRRMVRSSATVHVLSNPNFDQSWVPSDTCSSVYVCNWLGCEQVALADQSCNHSCTSAPLPQFCGICETESSCQEVPRHLLALSFLLLNVLIAF
jgi:hypothetical protein